MVDWQFRPITRWASKHAELAGATLNDVEQLLVGSDVLAWYEFLEEDVTQRRSGCDLANLK